MPYWVYILRCGDGTLYTGIARDVERRLAVHRSGKGAKYTRSRLPLTVVYQEALPDKSAALRREIAIKRLTRAEKLRLIAAGIGEHAMRRKDRETNEEFAWKVVDSCDYAVLAMTSEAGTPYCLPLNIVRKDRSVYFHSALEGRKAACLRQHPRVCLTCVSSAQVLEEKLTTLYESAVAFGDVTEVVSQEEKAQALGLLCQRHAPNNPEGAEACIRTALSRTAVFRLDITEISGKSNRR